MFRLDNLARRKSTAFRNLGVVRTSRPQRLKAAPRLARDGTSGTRALPIRCSPTDSLRSRILRLRGQLADQIDFGLAVGLSIGMQDFVEPDGGLVFNVGVVPG